MASRFVSSLHMDNEAYQNFLKEGLIIMGWVAMWKPLELILFDWWPLYDKMRVFKKIINASVEIICKRE